MPYRRPANKRRRRKPANQKAIRKVVRKELDKAIEDKMLFSNDPNNSVSNVITVFTPTSGIPQGTTAITRIGDAISLKSFELRLNLQQSGVATRTSVRLLVFWGKAPEVTYTNALLFFYNGTVGYEIVSPINIPESHGRFQIIYDKVFTLTAAGNTCINWKKKFKLGGRKCWWDRSGNTATNQLYYILVSDETVNTPVVDCAHLLKFEDA